MVEFSAKSLNQYTKSAIPHNEVQQHTSQKLATEFNVSKATIERDADFAKGIDVLSTVSPELKNEILQGKSDISKKEVQEIAKETGLIIWQSTK